MPESPSSGTPGGPRRRIGLGGRLFGSGARSARRVAGATGIDRAVEAAAEEAIVRAIESVAVERALARVLQGPAVEEAMQGALQSPAMERAIINALDSELVDHVWSRLLASDEAQKLVERIAEAPEVRSAIAAQGVGFVGDIGRQIGRAARRLDEVVEGLARRLLLRQRRTAATDRAGLVTRALALVLDGAIVNGVFAVVSALLALVVTGVEGSSDGVSTHALVAGAGVWAVGGSLYLVSFWSLVGQTPGMRFLGIRLDASGSTRIPPRQAVRRLIGAVLAAIPLGAGFLAILFSDRRRGWHDRIGDTEVVYAEPAGRAAPWTEPAPARV